MSKKADEFIEDRLSLGTLSHAGVKGMKWGVRKKSSSASGTRAPGSVLPYKTAANSRASRMEAKRRAAYNAKVASGKKKDAARQNKANSRVAVAGSKSKALGNEAAKLVIGAALLRTGLSVANLSSNANVRAGAQAATAIIAVVGSAKVAQNAIDIAAS